MVKIVDFPFEKEFLEEIRKTEFGEKWPVVYFIHNEKEAYIGETTNAFLRTSQHIANPNRESLKRIHLVTDKLFNKSAIMDIESSLIKYISADGKFVLQNLNSGLQNHNYYQQEIYQPIFFQIWRKLKKLQLVQSSLNDIENTDLFKFSPYKTLTTDQYIAVDFILDTLAKNFTTKTTHVISGSAGTGKTVLAIYLMKLLKAYENQTRIFEDEQDINYVKNIFNILEIKPSLKIALVIPMTSLRGTLKKVFKHIKGLSPDMVIGPNDVSRDFYDILIVDEAHRLRRRRNITNYRAFDNINQQLGFDNNGTELDWITKQSTHQILFYDSLQSIRPSDIPEEKFLELMIDQDRQYATYSLTSQLRCIGGNDYIQYIKEIFSDVGNLKKIHFKNYELKMFDDISVLKKELLQREEEFGLSRIVAGYAWPWNTKNSSLHEIHENNLFDIDIEGIRFIWNSTNKDWVNSSNAKNEVGCIHTTQGYDLNYSAIIVGSEIDYDWKIKKIIIKRENYFDINGLNNIQSEQQLKEYILHIYITLFTRGIRGSYVYVLNPNMRRYLSQFF